MADANLTPPSSTCRLVAGLIAVVTGLTLLTRIVLSAEETGSVLSALSNLSQFFTILTNTIVLMAMTLVAFGWKLPPRIMNAVIIAIAGVGVFYHTLLAHMVNLGGIELLADHGTHTFVPALSVIWWLIWGDRPVFTWKDPVIWTTWPLLYCAYILVRASFSGFYPYFFLDLPEVGMQGLVLNIAGLVAGFILIGIMLRGLARVFR